MTSSTSDSLFERARRVTPGGVHSPVRAFRGVGGVPRFIREARGSRITDVDGNSFIDFCMSFGPLIFGHQDPDIRAAVDAALGRGWTFGAAEAGSLELAEWITAHVPVVEQLRFVNSGTEAVMSALRVARAATNRTHLLKFEGCYHGHADSMLVKAGSGLAEMASPDSAGVTQQTASETLVAPLDDEAAVEALFARHGSQIAAMILEPLPANNGLLPQREAFWQSVCKLARQHGTLIIFDEVISGFRVGLGGMTERLGIEPDLVTYGKVIGGGFPVGAYGGRRRLMEWVAPVGPVYQAGTLSANPVAIAAGMATLRKLKANPPYAALERRTREMADNLEKLAARSGEMPVRVQADGSLFWLVVGAAPGMDNAIRSVSKIPGTHALAFARVFHALLKQGIYLAPSGFEVGFLSTAHTDADVEQFLIAFDRALATALRS
jgi:glutamate-1-semialdehyde 2,1-aminomutase